MPEDVIRISNKPTSPVVLWIDDDPANFDFVKGHLDERTRTYTFDDSNVLVEPGFWDHLERVSRPGVICLSAHSAPQVDVLRQFFDHVSVTGVISDLEIGGNPVAGMVVLSAAISSRNRPQTAILSGRIDQMTEELAKALGVNYVINKGHSSGQLFDVIFSWLGIERQGELSRRLMQTDDELQRLQRENSRLKKEGLKLRQELKAVRERPRPSPSRKAISASGEVVELRNQLTNIESRMQMVLAHHHDLINTSSLTVQALEQLASDPRLLPPLIVEELERARISAKHCDVLVASLTTLSSGVVRNKRPEPSSVEQALHEALQIVRRKIPEAISLTQDIPAKLPLCSIPEHLLVRCLLNLLLNSLEALPEGGVIDLTVTPPRNRSKYIKIYIRDNGKGIKKVDLPKLFSPDFSTKGKKHGLGLFIVKQVLDDFGGSVSVESVRGKGAKVTLQIPLA